MKALIKEEKGTAIIMAALMMVVLLGFAALAIDGGYLYFRHTRLQDIADTCALAACHQLGEETGDLSSKQIAAFNTAVEYAGKNNLNKVSVDNTTYSEVIKLGNDPGAELGTMEVTFPNDYKVKVNISLDSNLYFARVLGFEKTPVAVSATAKLGVVQNINDGLVPLCFFWNVDLEHVTPGAPFSLNLTSGSGESGSYGYLDYEPPNMFRNYLENGFNGDIIDQRIDQLGIQVYTYQGESTGIVGQEINDRVDRCIDSCTCKDFYENCPRVVTVPIVKDLLDSEASGKKLVTITGFARFFLNGYSVINGTKTLSGVFVGKVEWSSNTVDVTPENEFMIKSVKLIE